MGRELTDFVGCSAHAAAVRTEIDNAADSDAKVLITGESGVGKEVVARLVHLHSARHRMPYRPVNCAGVPDTLLESEFFGHARGSFTGAYQDRPGLFEVARRGTVLLDEIGEMSARMQGLLLRFLETGEIQRVGGTAVQQVVDVRVIAATNRDLVEQVRSRAFREDLYYRLNVIRIHVRPLRERREDAPVLARHFLDQFCRQYCAPRPEVTPAAFDELQAYDWPGNVRELRNVVERTVARFRGGVIAAFEVPSRRDTARPGTPAVQAPASPVDRMFARMTEQRESFWDVAHEPFRLRDITRVQIRELISKGLEQTCGSYKVMAELFNIQPGDYRRFLAVLRKHQCHVPFQPFRKPMAKPLETRGRQKDSQQEA